MAHGWTHAICMVCWHKQRGTELPYAVAHDEPEPERCCWCGEETVSGIYLRHSPEGLRCSD